MENNFFNEISIKTRKKKPKESLWQMSYIDLITNLLAFLVLIISMSVIDVTRFDALTSNITQKKSDSLLELKKKIDETTKKNHLEKLIKTSLYMNGLHIVFRSSSLFKSASDHFNKHTYDRALPILQLISASDPMYKMSFEGFTDDVGLKPGGKFLDNWQLSSARGLSLMKKVIGLGTSKERVSVAGYADTHQVASIKGLKGYALESARAKNRRVVIRIYQ